MDVTAAGQTGLTESGEYSLTITDNNGCKDTLSIDLTVPEPIEIVGEEKDLTCNASNGPADGTIDLTVTGGTAPYSYEWDSPDGAFYDDDDGPSQSGLTAGDFLVTVTDAIGCQATATFKLNEPPLIQMLVNAVNPECNALSGAASGSLTMQVTGGTPFTTGDGYTFAWTTDNGSGLVSDAVNQSGLSAGSYTLVVTDMNGCTNSDTYMLVEPDPIVITGSQEDLTCNSGTDAPTGSITIDDVTGGVGTTADDYIYEWSTTDGSGLVVDDRNQTGLTPGTYTVVVYDSDTKNCSATETFTLGEPPVLSCDIESPSLGADTQYQILCAGGVGTFIVTPTGGTPADDGTPYTYVLDGVEYTDSTFVDIVAGTHTVTVIDGNDCETICDITLNEPPAMTAGTCVVTNDECQLDDGQIEVAAAGGVAPYTVTWTSTSGGTLDQTMQTITTSDGSVIFTGAQGGETYIFTVTDANGCEY